MALSRLRGLNVLLVPGGVVLALALILFRPQIPPCWLDPLVPLFPGLVYILGLILGWSLDRARTVGGSPSSFFGTAAAIVC